MNLQNYTKKPLYIALFFSAFLFMSAIAPLKAENDKSQIYIKKARDHLNLFHYDKARAMLKKAIHLNPKNWEAFYLAGKTLIRQKRHYDAEKFLKKALQLNPNERDCQKALGAVYIMMAKQAKTEGNKIKMLDLLHKACQAYPSNTKIWNTLLENWRTTGDWEKIQNSGKTIVDNNQKVLSQGDDKALQKALVIVARAFYRAGNFPKADYFIKKASMIRQTNEELYQLKRELKSQESANIDKLVDQAKAEIDKKNYPKALTILNQAQKTSSTPRSDIEDLLEKTRKEKNITNFLAMANKAIDQKKYENALDILIEAENQYPYDKRISTLAQEIEKKVKDIRDALDRKNAKLIAAKKVLADKTNNFNNHFNDGKKKEEKELYDLAILSYEKALEYTDDKASLQAKIKELEEKSQTSKQRKQEFSVALAKAENLVSSGSLEEAYFAYQELQENYPEREKDFITGFAEVCLKLNKLQEAEDSLTVFESDSSQEALYNYIKACINYQRGNYSQAGELFARVNEINKNFRPDITKKRMYMFLHKIRYGLLICAIMLAFPLIKFIKGIIRNQQKKNILNKITRIRETGTYAENISFLKDRFEKEDVPNMKEVTMMYADALLRANEPEKAFELVNNLLKRDSRNANAKRIAGEACLASRETSSFALEHIQNLYKLDESRKDIVEYLANTYMAQKADHKLAQEFILKYLSFNPTATEAIIFLADLYIKRSLYSNQSIKIFEKAIKIAPDIPEYYSALIINYNELGQSQNAEDLSKTAKEKFPNDPNFGGNTTSMGDISSLPPTGYPDYDSIGNESPGVTQGGFPDYDNIGLPGESPQQTISPPPAPPLSNNTPADKLACPHCGAPNSLQEYYCNSCGKPLAG
eukprot:Anaeramoba_ignava/a481131_30.p1 GENE.a481131_30~~a481131_30.p1  ORF type:complete len:874 (+),score=90.62 a481131_30:11-2632(+)